MGCVREPLTRFVQRTVRAIGYRQLLGQAARCRNRIKLRCYREAIDTAGHEEESFAVGRPPAEAFNGGMMGHALGDATVDRQGVEVESLIIIGAEGDGLAIRRETRSALET